MPPLGRLMVRTALVWLLVGFTLGGLVLANKGLGWWPTLWRFRASHAHILLVGWMVQFSVGVAFWILPRLPGGSRGRETLVRLGYIALNAGVACGFLYDLLVASLDASLARFLPLAAGALYVAAFGLLAGQLWPRVLPLPEVALSSSPDPNPSDDPSSR
ncbi:MAG: hypothetical protein U0641_19245 [Anaerolineae bacterium]